MFLTLEDQMVFKMRVREKVKEGRTEGKGGEDEERERER
jgi:hypothetical protein